MGNFRIIINAVGNHGQDRSKKDGEEVNFFEGGQFTPDATAKRAVEELRRFGASLYDATIIHWPDEPTEVKDDLLTGKRTGNF